MRVHLLCTRQRMWTPQKLLKTPFATFTVVVAPYNSAVFFCFLYVNSHSLRYHQLACDSKTTMVKAPSSLQSLQKVDIHVFSCDKPTQKRNISSNTILLALACIHTFVWCSCPNVLPKKYPTFILNFIDKLKFNLTFFCSDPICVVHVKITRSVRGLWLVEREHHLFDKRSHIKCEFARTKKAE